MFYWYNPPHRTDQTHLQALSNHVDCYKAAGMKADVASGPDSDPSSEGVAPLVEDGEQRHPSSDPTRPHNRDGASETVAPAESVLPGAPIGSPPGPGRITGHPHDRLTRDGPEGEPQEASHRGSWSGERGPAAGGQRTGGVHILGPFLTPGASPSPTTRGQHKDFYI
ncbi:unnamed protein product [Boreogadus saida]